MTLEKIRDLIAGKDPAPNKFTVALGELIRKARENDGMSQKELADRIYRRQATLSDLEIGKSEVGTVTLVLLAAALEKPIRGNLTAKQHSQVLALFNSYNTRFTPALFINVDVKFAGKVPTIEQLKTVLQTYQNNQATPPQQ
jgi:transcriptional regulator with XRE-family HTH domain